MEYGVVIVGGSIAGYNVASTLRKEGYEYPIILINRQATLPYDISKLSKSWMVDVENEEPPLFQEEEYFTENNITLRFNTVVSEIKPDEKIVVTDDREEIPYDTLVLATGSTLRTLNLPGSDAKGVFYLRDFDMALKIKKWAQKVEDAVIIGAGFIGMELASSLNQLGLNVNVIELEDYPLGRVLGKDLSQYFRKMHEDHGVKFYTGEGVESMTVDDEGYVKAAITSSGKEIPCQMVIIGIGVFPNTTLSHPDLKEERGYIVNEYGETSLPDVYAVGDCAIWPYQGEQIHVEHWEHAFYHGRTIAKNIVEPKSKPYTERPYFWTDHYDQTFDYLGHAKSWDRIIVRGSLDDRKFTVVYVDENNYPIAIMTANKADKRKDLAKFMDKNEPIKEEEFKNLEKPLV